MHITGLVHKCNASENSETRECWIQMQFILCLALVVELGLKTEVELEKCRARVEWRARAEQRNNLEQTGQETTKVELKTTVEQAEQSTTAEPEEPKTMMKPREFRYVAVTELTGGTETSGMALVAITEQVESPETASLRLSASEHREFKSRRCLGRSCCGCSRLGRSMSWPKHIRWRLPSQ